MYRRVAGGMQSLVDDFIKHILPPTVPVRPNHRSRRLVQVSMKLLSRHFRNTYKKLKFGTKNLPALPQYVLSGICRALFYNIVVEINNLLRYGIKDVQPESAKSKRDAPAKTGLESKFQRYEGTPLTFSQCHHLVIVLMVVRDFFLDYYCHLEAPDSASARRDQATFGYSLVIEYAETINLAKFYLNSSVYFVKLFHTYPVDLEETSDTFVHQAVSLKLSRADLWHIIDRRQRDPTVNDRKDQQAALQHICQYPEPDE